MTWEMIIIVVFCYFKRGVLLNVCTWKQAKLSSMCLQGLRVITLVMSQLDKSFIFAAKGQKIEKKKALVQQSIFFRPGQSPIPNK